MNAARARRTPSTPAGGRAPRYRRHELALHDGGRLRLGADGVIERHDAQGSTTRSWSPGDPEWADQAIRFGLQAQPRTVPPHSQRVPDTRLPGA